MLRSPCHRGALATLAAASRADAAAAVEAGRAAFNAVALFSVERRAILSRAADLLEHRAPSIAVTMTEENGAAASWARFDVHVAVGIMGEAAVQAYRLVGEVLLSGVPGLRATAVAGPWVWSSASRRGTLRSSSARISASAC